MYSRKSIRSYQPMTRYLPTGQEDTAKEITPPPDYMGIAFSDRREREDFPETIIPALSKTEEESAPSVEEDLPLSDDPNADPVEADSMSAQSEEERDCPAEPNTEHLPTPALPEESESAAIEQSNAAESLESPKEAEPPLITPAWLRSLTLEDMLLFWLILLLLSGEPEDQIYLLLGLLLFTGR